MKKKIVSIGNLTSLFFVEEYARNHELEHKNFFQFFTPEDIFNVVLSENFDYIYIHLKHIDGVADDIVLMFQKLIEAAKGTIIVGAMEYPPSSDLVLEIKKAGVQNFILADIPFGQKEEFEKCMSGEESITSAVPDVPSIALTEEPKPQNHVAEIISHSSSKGTTIGVLSKTPRIGATTLAIQLTKYIKMMGYKACYIQMNDDGWVQLFDKWIDDTIHDSDMGYVSHQEITMYYKLEKISSILNMGYDYYIYDYGTNNDNVSFLEKDIKICAVGTFASEMDDTQALISTFYNHEVLYCFNLVPESERNDIIELMDNKSDSTFFLNYCCDPFFLSSENIEIFDNVFRINKKESSNDNSHNKRKRLFGR